MLAAVGAAALLCAWREAQRVLYVMIRCMLTPPLPPQIATAVGAVVLARRLNLQRPHPLGWPTELEATVAFLNVCLGAGGCLLTLGLPPQQPWPCGG